MSGAIFSGGASDTTHSIWSSSPTRVASSSSIGVSSDSEVMGEAEESDSVTSPGGPSESEESTSMVRLGGGSNGAA